MKAAPLPANEAERLQSLKEHEILDTLPEEAYDDITRIASEITGMPISLITLIDEDRQWFKSRNNSDVKETERKYSFCAHAIMEPDEVLIIQDARSDERFYDNPFVTSESNIVFYLGVPITDKIGNALGTLCVIDKRPRDLSDQQIEALRGLAKLVKAHLELRKTRLDFEKAQEHLKIIQSLVNTMLSDLPGLAKTDPLA